MFDGAVKSDSARGSTRTGSDSELRNYFSVHFGAGMLSYEHILLIQSLKLRQIKICQFDNNQDKKHNFK